MNKVSKSWLLMLLPLLYVLYYLLPLEFRALWQPDETRYAEISREMLANGNWVTPHFFDLRYFEKPVAGYWINTIGQWIFGRNNFAVRIGSVFCTTLSALMIYWLGLRIKLARSTALVASIIYLTSLLVYGVGTYAVLDPMLTLWLTAAMCSFWYASEAQTRRQSVCRYLLFGAACGMGFMTKGFLALVVPVLAIVPWMLKEKRFTQLLIFGPLALVSASLISAPWALAIHQQQPDFWHYFFWVEHIQRFAEENAQHKAPFWYYLPVLLAGTLPWLALLPGALKQGWSSSANTYLLSWVVLPLLFFSIARGKLPTYILPCFAPLALLMAQYGCELAKKGSRVLSINAWINILFGAAATLALLLVLAPWGLARRPLFAEDEMIKLALACLIFIGWMLAGLLSLRGSWLNAALSPLLLALCVGFVIPERIQNTKQPESFVSKVSGRLEESSYILTNSSGIAAAVAWKLQQSDIYFYKQRGELQYGLSFPDAQYRYISGAQLHEWLAQHRRYGSVSLILKLDRDAPLPQDLPPADFSYRSQRMLYLSFGTVP